MDLKDLLGREVEIDYRSAKALLDALVELWTQQAPLMKANPRTRVDLVELPHLRQDLRKLHHWFNPTATGRRLRGALETVPSLRPGLAAQVGGMDTLGDLVEKVDDSRVLVSPEGRVAMWIFAIGLDLSDDAKPDEGIWISQQYVMSAWATLHDTYFEWNRQRIRDVTGLLRDETATFRPSAIALLLVLLINRNTSKERRLPAPTEARLSDDVSRAIAQPALAFTRKLDGTRDSKADARGLEIYRGWAAGEIARRLGSGFHREDGIWIDEDTVGPAEDRLIAALAGRPAKQLAQVPFALNSLRDEYERVRPQLTTLGIAHERPSVTTRLVEKIVREVEERVAQSGDHEADSE